MRIISFSAKRRFSYSLLALTFLEACSMTLEIHELANSLVEILGLRTEKQSPRDLIAKISRSRLVRVRSHHQPALDTRRCLAFLTMMAWLQVFIEPTMLRARHCTLTLSQTELLHRPFLCRPTTLSSGSWRCLSPHEVCSKSPEFGTRLLSPRY